MCKERERGLHVHAYPAMSLPGGGRGGARQWSKVTLVCASGNSAHLPSGAFHGLLLPQTCLGSVEEGKLGRRHTSASCQDNELGEAREAEGVRWKRACSPTQWSSTWGDEDELFIQSCVLLIASYCTASFSLSD